MNDRWLDPPRTESDRLLREALDAAAARTGDDMLRRRLWARVQTPPPEAPPRQHPLWAAAVIGVAVLGAAGGLFVWPGARDQRQQARPIAAPTEPGVVSAVPAADPRPLLRGPAVVKTHVRERLALTLPGGAEAELEPGSELLVDEVQRASLQQGRIALSVRKRPSGEEFTFRAGRFLIVVRGTHFHVRVAGPSVGVDVDEGMVEVWDGERQAARLSAGESWTSPPIVEAVAPAETEAAVPAARARHAISPARAAPPIRQAEADARFRAARAALTAGNFDEALRALTALASGQGPAAENAAYEVGRVLREHLLRPREALAAWNRYRARFPGGLLQAETDLSIVETLATLGDAERALVEAEAFLRRYPASERRPEIERLAQRLRASAPE